MFAKITGTGSYLPEKLLTNDDLVSTVDTSDEWITQRTGIKQRHIASDTETSATMGTQASKKAIEAANITVNDIDMIIVATCTPPQIFPSVACLIQAELGVTRFIPAFDVQAACSGFLYILSIANQYIKSGLAKNVLLVGTEVMSRVIDWSDRKTCVLFGDGAGAVILSAANTPGILSVNLYSDGLEKDILYLNNAKMKPESPYLMMEGPSVFKLAVKRLSMVAKQELEEHNLSVNDIDWIVPHQANIRIIQATMTNLGIDLDKVITTVEQHANTSGASIPMALDYAVKNNKVKPGQKILFEAFGGGLTWASAVAVF